MWAKQPDDPKSSYQFPRVGTLRKGFDQENPLGSDSPSATVNDESSSGMAEVEKTPTSTSVAGSRVSMKVCALKERHNLKRTRREHD